jgi:type III pantothenate kinase
MILACDIGNTNISVGLVRGNRPAFKAVLATEDFRQLGKFLKKNLKENHIAPFAVKAGAICSVVPRINAQVRRVLRDVLNAEVYTVGEHFTVPIKNRYFSPRQVGQDRLVCAYMAMRLYGAPVISVDLGTAITLDIVSKDKAYLGGIILPGLGLSLSSLARQTALLPKVVPARAKSLIGRNTRQSMLSGITFGFGSMIDGLIERLKKELKPSPKAVMTGGDSLLLKPYCGKVDYFQPDLILKGIAQLTINFLKNT